ncbi:protein plant cadmium resistance 2-like [Plakobranchus ocellatus]|uniref:Protein plant cadmium resistance 2-like n=1 Tax=Plakobranchus ocellatus TaxID=259542 RepID=A0AAV4C5S3_9GAST|nr:protein plant cadmium resistance 2-like [Plakobranchus ocellatus]
MSADWQHGLFGCFDNFGLCIITFIAPCYTLGKNAEAVGESCLTCGLLYLLPIGNIVTAVQIRGKIREQRGIPGSTLNDFLNSCCCMLCSLVQAAQEVQVPGGQAMARE